MNFNELTHGRFTGKVSTGNSTQPLLPREPHMPPYVKGEADPGRPEPQEVYLPYARQHASQFGVKIVATLRQALEFRRQKLAVLTIREADIAARSKIPLDSDFLHKALQAIDGIIIEGIPGEKENPYHLREFYNRGVAFRKQYYQAADKAKRETADKAMGDTLAKLAAAQLPAWPEEIEHGFVTELCKPEFMDWSQYRAAAANYKSREPEQFVADQPVWSGEVAGETPK